MKFGTLSILIGIIVFMSQNSISFLPIANERKIMETQIKPLEELSLASMLIFQKSTNNTCIDIREEQYYKYSHIPGAINLSQKNLDLPLPEPLLKTLKSSSNIIIYSNAYANDELRNAVEILAKNGIENVKVYSAGWEEWKACKLPVEKSQ